MATSRTDGSAASGWIVLAAVLMIFGGISAILQGVAAIAKDTVFVVTGNYTFRFDLSAWGWIHLVLGVLVVLVGLLLLRGALWARTVGAVIVGLSMLANFMWLPYIPFWALAMILLDGVVIWALCTAPGRRHAAV
ncbi:hypothetical protein ACIP98_17730 [Streptomyces sp. NPDC088354]|uniref:DUF7144 family membrane protein n=1 Tax=unclassified Streptomyces TaxID=2593676 RepID=UPI0029BC33F4|nr:hypothetical protein [Streptomyces sp. MI02-7b]MDX3075093.1 hypothetical protein [Streptomyces sp. MI02-7b]